MTREEKIITAEIEYWNGIESGAGALFSAGQHFGAVISLSSVLAAIGRGITAEEHEEEIALRVGKGAE